MWCTVGSIPTWNGAGMWKRCTGALLAAYYLKWCCYGEGGTLLAAYYLCLRWCLRCLRRCTVSIIYFLKGCGCVRVINLYPYIPKVLLVCTGGALLAIYFPEVVLMCAGGARPVGRKPAVCPAGGPAPRLEQAGGRVPLTGNWPCIYIHKIFSILHGNNWKISFILQLDVTVLKLLSTNYFKWTKSYLTISKDTNPNLWK